jgi:hypothetical protein
MHDTNTFISKLLKGWHTLYTRYPFTNTEIIFSSLFSQSGEKDYYPCNLLQATIENSNAHVSGITLGVKEKMRTFRAGPIDMPDRSIFEVGPDKVQDNQISSNFLGSPRHYLYQDTKYALSGHSSASTPMSWLPSATSAPSPTVCLRLTHLTSLPYTFLLFPTRPYSFLCLLPTPANHPSSGTSKLLLLVHSLIVWAQWSHSVLQRANGYRGHSSITLLLPI